MSKQNPLLSRRIDETGDGTGNNQMNVNGAITPVIFKIAPAAGEIMMLSRVIVYLRDTGAFDADKWGNNITMVNGLQMKIKQDGETVNFADAIVSSGELGGLAHDLDHNSFGTGDETMSARLTFTKFGQYIRLDGDEGDEFQCVVNDDLTGLEDQHYTVQGYYEKR